MVYEVETDETCRLFLHLFPVAHALFRIPVREQINPRKVKSSSPKLQFSFSSGFALQVWENTPL
jgi:hypothetical protein